MAKLSEVRNSSRPSEALDLSKDEALQMLLEGGMSHEYTLTESIIVLLGSYKVGKTFCAATISKFYPESLPTKSMVKLLDMYWLPFDTGALDGMGEQGLTIPAPYDLRLHVAEPTLKQYLDKIYLAVDRAISFHRAGLTKYLVVDTISSFDSVIMAYLKKKYPGDDKTIWGEVAQIHSDFLQKLISSGCQLIVIGHIKEIFEIISKHDDGSSEKKAKNRRLTNMMPGIADIQLKITGQSSGLYKGHGSMVLPVIKTKDKYELFLETTKGVEGGSRFLRGLEVRQPAHLGKLLEKIRENQPV